MKRILFLGASPTQVAPIEYARAKGYYTITCDNLPSNIGHTYAHESHKVSTTDKDKVLALARRRRIDAVIAYASDPAAPTSAYVGEALGLPSNPYESVLTLARKDLFREFLARNDFNVPKFGSFENREEARDFMSDLSQPVYIKPVDSSGSKGVTRLEDDTGFDAAFDHALRYSRAKKVILEEGIERSGYQVGGDGFVVDGQLVFRCFANEHLSLWRNGLPISDSYPSIHSATQQATAHLQVQRVIDLLGMRFGALNFDFVFDADGQLYFLEIGPRNGGNLIPDVTKLSTGVDLISYTVNASLGNDVSDLGMTEPCGFWGSYMIHSIESGTYRDLIVSDGIRSKIRRLDLSLTPGTEVRAFRGSNDSLGTMILEFEDLTEMLEAMDHMEQDVLIKVD